VEKFAVFSQCLVMSWKLAIVSMERY